MAKFKRILLKLSGESLMGTKKSPWQYSLEVFQGIPPRIFIAVP